jgi:hypothetical protein
MIRPKFLMGTVTKNEIAGRSAAERHWRNASPGIFLVTYKINPKQMLELIELSAN